MTVYVISKTDLYIRTVKDVSNIALGDDGIYRLSVPIGGPHTYSKNDFYIQISILEEE